jgi:hypothetical protein
MAAASRRRARHYLSATQRRPALIGNNNTGPGQIGASRRPPPATTTTPSVARRPHGRRPAQAVAGSLARYRPAGIDSSPASPRHNRTCRHFRAAPPAPLHRPASSRHGHLDRAAPTRTPTCAQVELIGLLRPALAERSRRPAAVSAPPTRHPFNEYHFAPSAAQSLPVTATRQPAASECSRSSPAPHGVPAAARAQSCSPFAQGAGWPASSSSSGGGA